VENGMHLIEEKTSNNYRVFNFDLKIVGYVKRRERQI
jgi:hypothetical protein